MLARTFFIFFALPLLIGGCSFVQNSHEEPLALSVSFDKTAYKIGEPVIATVSVHNNTKKDMTIVRFNGQSVRFLMTRKGVFINTCREPVQSKDVISEARTLKGGETLNRPFVFTQLTENEGEYAMIANFKGAFQNEELATLFSVPVEYKVTDEVAFKRDKNNGFILKENALETARNSIKGKVLEERIVLIGQGESGLYTWVAMIRYEGEDGRERRMTAHVDPYMGKIRPVELKEANVSAESMPTPQKGK